MERDIDRFASSIHLLLPQMIVHPTIHKRFTSQVVLKRILPLFTTGLFQIPTQRPAPQKNLPTLENPQKQGHD